MEDSTPARYDLNKISCTVHDEKDRTWRGFNLFLAEDQRIVLAILQGEFTINGLRNRLLIAGEKLIENLLLPKIMPEKV